MRIHKIEFVDLYIGKGFSEITGINGKPGRSAVPAPLLADVRELRNECADKYGRYGEEEFSLNVEGTMFRVTVMEDLTEEVTFVLRRSSASIRPATSLPLAPSILEFLLSEDLRGLILIAGEMATGKTSTASTLFAERLARYGGMGVAIEDPCETPLHGERGRGRCIQMWATEKRGGYQAFLKKALRSGAGLFLVGEIRDEKTALEVARASINGHMVLSTIHADSPANAVQRFHSLCSGQSPRASDLIADGLAAVVWQTIRRRSQDQRNATRLETKVLRVRGIHAVTAKIRDGKFAMLDQDVVDQANKVAFEMQQAMRAQGVTA